MVFKIPSVYDYITKLCLRETEVIANYQNSNVHAIGQGEAKHGQAYDHSSVCRFGKVE
jgi:hypothetical protein